MTNAPAELIAAYAEFNAGSQGFCIAVETNCGFEISRAEIERIADRAATPAEFVRIWENENDWRD